jgi:hypothetical protein
MAPLLRGQSAADHGDLAPCDRCGAPTTGTVCAFCLLVEKASGREAVPVEMLTKRGRKGSS